MALRTWDPLMELDALRRGVEQVFEDFGNWRMPFARFGFVPSAAVQTYPMLNISENADNIYVEALAPGLNLDTLEISVIQNELRMTGEKLALAENIKPEAFQRRERAAGKFTRTVTLPTPVDSNKVTAEYKNGLLKITMPKAEEAKPKKIPIAVS